MKAFVDVRIVHHAVVTIDLEDGENLEDARRRAVDDVSCGDAGRATEVLNIDADTAWLADEPCESKPMTAADGVTQFTWCVLHLSSIADGKTRCHYVAELEALVS